MIAVEHCYLPRGTRFSQQAKRVLLGDLTEDPAG